MTLPDTTTLDIPSRGGPALGLYKIQSATPAVSTFDLDTPTRGLPYLCLYPKIYAVNISGGITISGSTARTAGTASIAIAGGMAISGSPNKQIGKTLAGGIAVTGGVGKQVPVSFSGVMAVSATLTKQIQMSLRGGIAITTAFSGPNGSQQATKTQAVVLVNQGTTIIAIVPYTEGDA